MKVLLYHWSPVERRASIKRLGLVPGRLSRCGQWRPPYVCLGTSPSAAWGLSGGMPHNTIPAWDLWMTDTDAIGEFTVRPDMPSEYRVYHRIYKRDVWYVATREAR